MIVVDRLAEFKYRARRPGMANEFAAAPNSKLKLSQWAEAYERKRGKVFRPQRVRNNARRLLPRC
jgi:hypothetical protein